jgi:hypothetical protein
MPRSFLEAVEKGDAVLEWQWAVERYDDFVEERCKELTRRSTMLLRSFGAGRGVLASFSEAEVKA